MPRKVLWTVNCRDIDALLATALAMGATRVALRSDNDVTAAVKAFHSKRIEVFGWRWPYSDADNAAREADRAAGHFAAGMDGYYIDPEGAPGEAWDWDKPGLAGVARSFCAHVAAAAAGRPIGVTSHYRAAEVFPHIPWAEFFAASQVFLPQAYWRSTGGRIGSGLPNVNYTTSIEAWKRIGAPAAAIEPMAGELGVVTAQEVTAYATAAAAGGVHTLHFYASNNRVTREVWQAIKAI